MNSEFLTNITRFFLLLLIQVAVFNNIYIFGYITPYLYILFILLYPINSNRYGFLFLSFLLGLIIDMFSNSGGIHAASCLVLAYYRNHIFRLSFGLSYEYQTLKIEHSPLKEQILFVSYSVLLHHFILFTLEAFSFVLIGKALLKILLSSIFTIIFNVLIINLFKAFKK